jgi:hypothetical protein
VALPCSHDLGLHTPSSLRLCRRAIFFRIFGLLAVGSDAVRSTAREPSPPPTSSSPVGASQQAVAPICTHGAGRAEPGVSGARATDCRAKPA